MERVFNLLKDMECLRHLPTEVLGLVKNYAMQRSIEGRFMGTIYDPNTTGPAHIAISEATQEILVLTGGVEVFSLTDFTFLRAWGKRSYGEGRLEHAFGICIDRVTSNVIITNTDGSGGRRLFEFKSDGTFFRYIGADYYRQNDHKPWGVAMDGEGRLVYVSDFNAHCISVFSLQDGRFLRRFGSKGSGDSQFDSPRGLHFDEERKLLLIADCGNHRVKVVRADGSLLRTLGDEFGGGDADDQLHHPWDVTLNTIVGEVYVADANNRRIQVFSLFTGQSIRRFDRMESVEWSKSFPTCVYYDAHMSRLFVAGAYNNVSIFE